MKIDLHKLPSLPQSQDSASEQLARLIQVANRLGLYDAVAGRGRRGCGAVSKKRRLHWAVIVWQLPLLLPFAVLELILEALTAATWAAYCLADKARDSWLEIWFSMKANLPPMYSHHHGDHQ
jgi:hypothetical protein